MLPRLPHSPAPEIVGCAYVVHFVPAWRQLELNLHTAMQMKICAAIRAVQNAAPTVRPV